MDDELYIEAQQIDDKQALMPAPIAAPMQAAKKATPDNHGKPWKPQECTQLIDECKKGMSWEEIGVAHKRTTGGILARISADIKRLNTAGKSREEIAGVLGLTVEKIDSVLTNGKKAPEPREVKVKVPQQVQPQEPMQAFIPVAPIPITINELTGKRKPIERKPVQISPQSIEQLCDVIKSQHDTIKLNHEMIRMMQAQIDDLKAQVRDLS